MPKRKNLRWLQSGAWLVFALLACLIALGWTRSVDVAISYWIHAHSSSTLDSIMLVLTKLGDAEVVAPLVVLTAGLMWRYGRREDGWFVVGGVAAAAAANLGLKFLFERPRPELWQSAINESGFSFPSGHAMVSSAFLLSLMYIAWNTRWRVPAIVAACVIIPVIGFSRVYLGVHYPADILGGWLAALALVLTLANSKLRTWLRSPTGSENH